METYYSFRKKLFGGVWEIKSDMPHRTLKAYPFDEANLPLLDLPFRICHGKKQRDMIYYFGDISIEFVSQNVYSLLSKYVAVDNYLYPIHINDVEDVYYFIHKLPEYQFVNRNVIIPNTNYECEVPCFLLEKDMPSFFTLNNTLCRIVTSEMKDAMVKAKLTNIVFEPIYGLSSMEEYYELQKNDKLHRSIYKK